MLFALPGVYWLVRRDGRLGLGKGAGWGLLAGVAFAADLSLWHRSMQYTSAANSTFIVCGLAPVWVALFSVAVYQTRYRWTGWLGQALGVSGALVLALARGARVGTGRGEVLAVLASFCYAGFSLAISRSRQRISARQSLFWMSVASLLCFVVLEAIEGQPLQGYSPRAWVGMVATGVGGATSGLAHDQQGPWSHQHRSRYPGTWISASGNAISRGIVSGRAAAPAGLVWRPSHRRGDLPGSDRGALSAGAVSTSLNSAVRRRLVVNLAQFPQTIGRLFGCRIPLGHAEHFKPNLEFPHAGAAQQRRKEVHMKLEVAGSSSELGGSPWNRGNCTGRGCRSG